MQLDLGGMLAALEKQQHAPHAKPSSRPVVFSGRYLCTSARAQSCFPRLFSKYFLLRGCSYHHRRGCWDNHGYGWWRRVESRNEPECLCQLVTDKRAESTGTSLEKDAEIMWHRTVYSPTDGNKLWWTSVLYIGSARLARATWWEHLRKSQLVKIFRTQRNPVSK